MSEYIVDSSAWIEYFLASDRGLRVKEIIENDNNQCFTSSLSVAEITAKLKKSALDFNMAFEVIKRLSLVVPLEGELAFEAGVLYVEKRKKLKDIGIVDVLIMAQAKKDDLRILTGDKSHFKDEKNAVLI